MKIAVVQMDIVLGQVNHNLTRMLEFYRQAREAGAELVIFPECAVTGYCFDAVEQARPFAESIPGPSTERFRVALSELGGTALFGLIEARGEGISNVAVIVDGTGVRAHYRKIHLPGLGIDRFAIAGEEPFRVYNVNGLQVGLAICYDSAFPEAMRTLALQGADLIALPTNFPCGAEGMTQFVLRTRALENKVFFAGCNRVGEEAGFRFFGGSQICGVGGEHLAGPAEGVETILYAEIDPALSRDKRVGRPPIPHAIDRFADRRPAMYGKLLEPVSKIPAGSGA